MRAFALGLIAGLAMAGQAMAADMPVKAVPNTLVTYQGAQWYLLAGTVAETDRASVTGPNGVAFNGYAAGGKLVAGVGRIWAISVNRWAAIEAMAELQNVGSTSSGAQLTPGSVNTKGASFTQRFLLGGDWLTAFIGNLAANIPNLGLPVLPVGSQGAHPYVFAATHEAQVGADYMLDPSKVWRFSAGAGLGLQTQWTPTTPNAVPVTSDLFTELKLSNSNVTIGNGGKPASATMGMGAMAGILFKH